MENQWIKKGTIKKCWAQDKQSSMNSQSERTEKQHSYIHTHDLYCPLVPANTYFNGNVMKRWYFSKTTLPRSQLCSASHLQRKILFFTNYRRIYICFFNRKTLLGMLSVSTVSEKESSWMQGIYRVVTKHKTGYHRVINSIR